MAKHSTKKSSRQELVVVNAATVQIPLPLLAALEDAESAFFGVAPAVSISERNTRGERSSFDSPMGGVAGWVMAQGVRIV